MTYYKLAVRTKVNVNPELDPSIWFLNEEGHELFSKIRRYGCDDFRDCLQTYLDGKVPGNRISVYMVDCETDKTEPVVYRKKGVIKALARDKEAAGVFEDLVKQYFLDVNLESTEVVTEL